ncbi:MAG: methyltransferase domain-containing protein [Anaerovoracaceae bacterium]
MDKKLLDRINEAYKGELGEEMKTAARERIFWICENTYGNKILDVGCSQGIVSILLAKDGKDVKGIDIESEQINYAVSELKKEDIFVQGKVSFVCGDFLEYDFKNEKFDTIIMGECLEHVFKPTMFLDKAKELLDENGKLIVTVPFGINPHPDHKRTYYFLEIFNEIDERIHISSVKFFGKWLGVIANKELSKSEFNIDTGLVKMMEDAFFSIDKNNHSILLSQNKRIDKLLGEVEEKKKSILEISSENKKLKDIISKNDKNLSVLHKEIEFLKKELAYRDDEISSVKDEKNLLKKENFKIQSKFNEMNNLFQNENNSQKDKLISLEKLISRKEEEILKSKSITAEIENSNKNLVEESVILKDEINQAKKESRLWQDKFNEMNSVAYSGKRKIKSLTIQNKELQDRYVLYKEAYNALFSLRGIKVWIKARDLIGKPYKIVDEKILVGDDNKRNSNDKNNSYSNSGKISITAEEKRKAYENISINSNFYKNIEEITKEIKDSNGSGYYKKTDLKVGIITDEFMFNYYKDSLNLIYLSPVNYKEVIDKEDIEFVLFVSCWHGMYGNEDYSGEIKRNTIIDIFHYAQDNKIPVVFQTIEDPTNYNVFLKIAKASDYIFTSDLSMIDRYKSDTGNDNVFYLGYGINPQFHNPIGSFIKRRKKDYTHKVFFAGSWNERYPKRCSDISMLFDGVIDSKKYDLIVADRNMNINGYAYPEKYVKYLIPPVRHDLLQKVHKLFDYTLNVNTITHSPTMCAMRVYEVQALGNLLISNYSLASSNIFPGIFNIISSDEIDKILNGYKENEIISMELKGIRDVFTNYTVYDRLNFIFEKIGVKHRYTEKAVYVLYDKLTDNIRESFDRQLYKKKELYSVEEFLKKDEQEGYFIVFKDDIYDDNYILDLINATKYTDTEYIIYCNYNDKEISFEFVDDRNTREETLYDLSKVKPVDVLEKANRLKKGFAIPYLVTNEDTTNSEKELAVIIPVYNNGKYLRDRAIRSLLRSSIFSIMQIYIIDDGSTDGETRKYIDEIMSEYDNIKAFFFNDGGSGSASRPRNKGVEISKEKYITYLDPDNEAINDGYAILLDDIKEKNVDFAFGDIIKVGNTISPLCFEYENKLIKSPKEELIAKKFKTNSIQACVIKRELIEKNGIENPVGAIGQDTMFFYELMLNSKKTYHRCLPIHIYYAQRGASVVNDIEKKFFDKSYIMEKYQSNQLKKYGVFEEYKNEKFKQFYNEWYLEKLKLVKEDIDKCEKIVESIFDLYN